MNKRQKKVTGGAVVNALVKWFLASVRGERGGELFLVGKPVTEVRH